MQIEDTKIADTKPNAQAPADGSARAEETQPAASLNGDSQEASAASEEGTQGEGNPPPKKTNVEKRIGKLTKKVSEERRRAEYWENEAKRLQSTNPPPAAATQEAVNVPKAEPKLEDFTTYAEYTNALVDWKVEQKELIRERKAAETRARETIETGARTYQEKLREFTKAKPDFNDRLAAVSDVQMPVALQERMRKAGPEVIYEMMDDPDEFRRICSLEIGDAIEEIGLVKAKIKATSKPTEEEPPPTPKPKPPTPVGSKVTPVKDWKKMSLREYDEWRRKGNTPTG